MMKDWALVFPPLISSNWGNYYPSIALLDAVLAEVEVSAHQVDLNEEFLDYLIDPGRLSRLEAAYRRLGRTPVDDIPQRSAIQLAQLHRGAIVNARGQHLCDGEWNGLDLTVELSRPFHIDKPVTGLPALLQGSEVARTYQDFFSWSTYAKVIERTGRAVGISVPMGPQLGPTILLARLTKAWRPDLRVVLGGPTLTLMRPGDLSALLEAVPEIDCVVRFEGEPALRALATQLRDDQWKPEEVDGVVVRGVGPTRPRRAPPAMNRLPSARFSEALLHRLESPRVGVLQARGCYWGKCTYCDFIELFTNTGRYAGRAPSNVFQEVQGLAERYGIHRYWLITEALPPKQGLRFAEEVVRTGLSVDWRSFAMVDDGFTTEVLRAFQESGCSSLTIGLETMSDRVLKLVEKKVGSQENLRFFERVRAAGMKISVNLIPNLPSTTYAEAMDSLELLRPFADIFHTVAVFPYEATASSAVGRNPERFGLRVLNNGAAGGQAQFSSNTLKCEDPAMTQEELAEVLSAYERFSRSVRSAAAEGVAQRRQEEASRTGRGGYQFRSNRIAVLEDDDGSVVYDWNRDRAWRLPRYVLGSLQRMQRSSEPFRRAHVANWFAETTAPSQIPVRTELLFNELRAMGLLKAC